MNRLAIALLLLVLPGLAMAERLRVDVLIFLNPPSAVERATPPRHPDSEGAFALDDLRGLAYKGIALLPENSSTLAVEWAALKASRIYTPLLRLSWLQQSPPEERGAALRIYQPGGDGISGLGGWLRLHGGLYPALTADLEYLQPGIDRQAQGLRLQQRRRLGMDTLHYLDSTRIGMLVRVSTAL